MPWTPELFSAPALQQVLERRQRDQLLAVPFFDGLMAGELDALVDSFAGEPELHDPVRGRVKGVRAFRDYVTTTSEWHQHHAVSVDDAVHVLDDQRGVEETVLHLDGDTGPIDLPVAIVADHQPDGRLTELRIYHSTWPLTGRRTTRPPLLQPDPALRLPAPLVDYQRALAKGDALAIVAAFEADGYARDPVGSEFANADQGGLRAFYEMLFSNGGGMPLEVCTVIDDDRACALEYNVVDWGRTTLSPQAGVAVYVRGSSGRLSAARIYDDVDPPVSSQS